MCASTGMQTCGARRASMVGDSGRQGACVPVPRTGCARARIAANLIGAAPLLLLPASVRAAPRQRTSASPYAVAIIHKTRQTRRERDRTARPDALPTPEGRRRVLPCAPGPSVACSEDSTVNWHWTWKARRTSHSSCVSSPSGNKVRASDNHGHTISRQKCVHRQAWKHEENCASSCASTGMET